MGLDMAVYKISRSHLDTDVIYNEIDLCEQENVIILNEEDIQSPIYREVIPYTQKISTKSDSILAQKIAEDFGLSRDAFATGWDGLYLEVKNKTNGKYVRIPAERVSQYVTEQTDDAFVARMDDVASWRNAYDIQQWFHEHIESTVENTGYYLLSLETIAAFNKTFDENLPAIAPDEESALFYWEWY